jgi:hypothetical protein
MAKQMVKPAATSKVTANKQTLNVEIYASPKKSTYVVAVKGKEQAKWFEIALNENAAKRFYESDGSAVTIGKRTYKIISTKNGKALTGDDGDPLVTAEALSLGFIIGGLFVVGTLGILGGLWYLLGEKGSKAIDEAGNTIADSTGSGFWDDGSADCSQDRIPILLC